MNKACLLAGAALFAAAPAFAQSLRFGLKAGANLSSLAGSLANQDQYRTRWGFHGGVMLNVGLVDDDFLSLQPEVLYSQKGFGYDEGFTVPGFAYRNTGSVRYDYLDVPLLLRLKTQGVFFEVGPQYSYLLNVSSSRSRTYTIGGVPALNTYNADTEDLSKVNRNELGYAAGLGYQARDGFLIGVRYNGAFTDFAKDGYSGNDFRNARHAAFQGYVGVLLGGK